jgi:hypothetical protein
MNGLKFLAAEGIISDNLKPSTILLSDSGIYKLG